MSEPSVYIETSVLSYLTARSSRDLIVAANQQITLDWWELRRHRYRIVVSAVVIQEASMGDESVAKRRLAALAEIEIVEVTDRAVQLAAMLVERAVVPQNAVQDALHIAVASVNRIDYLLTWNYKHIANAAMREAINTAVRAAGFEPPVICTPAELGE
jgi:predicted nucleic acid-binding protein